MEAPTIETDEYKCTNVTNCPFCLSYMLQHGVGRTRSRTYRNTPAVYSIPAGFIKKCFCMLDFIAKCALYNKFYDPGVDFSY